MAWSSGLAVERKAVAVSFRPCSICEQRFPGKPAAVYAAWFKADGVRIGWKQRLCPGCFSAAYLALLKAANSNGADADTCPSCGQSNSDDLDPIYLTLYLPKQPEREYELATDAACAAKLRLVLQQGADRLEDRSASGRGPTTSTTVWDAVELD